jgi:hypothetical protein
LEANKIIIQGLFQAIVMIPKILNQAVRKRMKAARPSLKHLLKKMSTQ